MQTAPLKSLIRQGEGTQVEFKKTLTHLPKIAKTLTAFANNRGGTIIVGVLDNHDIIGANPDEESFMVLQAARDWCFPPIDIGLKEEECEGVTLLVIDVPESDTKPHKARDQANDWKTYIRTDDRCVIADAGTEKQLARQPVKAERPTRRETFTRHEQAVFSWLKLHKRLAVKDYARIINVSRSRAAKILFELMREGFLFEHHEGKAVYYVGR